MYWFAQNLIPPPPPPPQVLTDSQQSPEKSPPAPSVWPWSFYTPDLEGRRPGLKLEARLLAYRHPRAPPPGAPPSLLAALWKSLLGHGELGPGGDPGERTYSAALSLLDLTLQLL